MNVSILVTAYLEESKPYLDLCIASINNLAYDRTKIEIIVVSPHWYQPTYPGVATVIPTKEKYYNAHALNYAASIAHGDYFLFLNDDVILTRHSLTNLVEAAQQLQNQAIVMPIGNDMQQRYHLSVHIPTGPYRIENIKPVSTQLMNLNSPYNGGFIFCETMCLYAVLVPRQIFKEVGEFDGSRQGQDDLDWTLRVRQMGYVNAIALSSLVYHAGGVSASRTFTEASRAESMKSFNEKWPSGAP